MATNEEISTWWNGMTSEQRLEKAKELCFVVELDDWTLPWEKLWSGQQVKLASALHALTGTEP